MPRHTISTLSTGDVIAYRHTDDASTAQLRTYKLRGRHVYLLRDGGVDLPMCRGLSTHGKPLIVRQGETLAEVIARELEPAKPRAAWSVRAAGWALQIFCGAVLVAMFSGGCTG